MSKKRNILLDKANTNHISLKKQGLSPKKRTLWLHTSGFSDA